MSEIVQGSPEWFAVRCGKVTASRIADLMAKTKSGPSASRATYMGQLIAERLTGNPQDSYTNAAMQWGTETEPQARAAYCFMQNVEVQEVGFVEHPYIEHSGCSPDGLVWMPGLIEIKCPNTATHIETLLSGTVPQKYVYQMQWQLACTEREWCDFISFDPRMPPSMQLFVSRQQRDDDLIKIIEKEVTAFLAELENKVAALRTRYELTQTLKEAAE